MDLEDVNEKLHELSVTRKKSTTFEEEFEAWKEWCKMWEQKEALEKAKQASASVYAL